MKIGILGAGFMGKTHIRAFSKVPDVQIGAISSHHIRSEVAALADQVGARATLEPMEIIEDPTIDAISNTLPTYLHADFTIAALEAGKHVLVEKPFALSLADCDRMIEAQRRSGKQLVVGHVVRFWEEYVALSEFLKRGLLGQPLTAVATRLSQPPAWSKWLSDPALSGGAVLDLCVHDFDAVNWILGRPKTIFARGQQSRPGMWSHVNAVVGYESASGIVEGSHFMPEGFPFTVGMRVLCEKGVVEFAFRAGSKGADFDGQSSLSVYESGKTYSLQHGSRDAFHNQAAYFIACARSDIEPTQGTPQQARLAVSMAHCARQSIETGKIVAIEP